MSYVNQIKDKEQEMHDIQDKRIPDVTADDNGKVLVVNEDGNIAPTTISGGTQLYKHYLRKVGGTVEYISADPTPKSLDKLLRIVSIDPSGQFSYDGITTTAHIRRAGPIFLSYISTSLTYNSQVDITTFWNDATDTVTPL